MKVDMKKVNEHLVKPAKIQFNLELEVPGIVDLENLDLIDVAYRINDCLAENLVVPQLLIKSIFAKPFRVLHKDNRRRWQRIHLEK